MKKFRIWCAIIAITAIGCNDLVAQNTKRHSSQQTTPEQRIEMRVKRMQQSLMLDDKTAAQFAPLYKEYLQETANLKSERPNSDYSEMSDTQIEESMMQQFEQQQKYLNLRKEYYHKFKKFLSARQIQKIINPQINIEKSKQDYYNKRNSRRSFR